MKKTILQVCLTLLMLTLTNGTAFAATYYANVSGGGKLSYIAIVTSYTVHCTAPVPLVAKRSGAVGGDMSPLLLYGGANYTYSTSIYSDFQYFASGNAVSSPGIALDGTVRSVNDPSVPDGSTTLGCNIPASSFPSVKLTAPGVTITFTPSGTGGGSATLNQYGIQGYVNPKYNVLGVTYAPPGASSYVTYTNSALVGNTATTTSSFQSDVNLSVSVEEDISAWAFIGNLSQKLTESASYDHTQGTNSSSTVTISKAATTSYQTMGTPTCSPVNHDYDTIWLWLNPLAVFKVFPGTTNLQWNGYGYDPNDPAGTEGMDIVPIQVGYLNGHFGSNPTINAILQRTWASYLIWPSSSGPEITSEDIANILAADPFTNPSYTLPTPLPSTTADGRFTQIPYPPNPISYLPEQLTSAYNTVNVNSQSNSSGSSHSNKVGFGLDEKLTGGAGAIFSASLSIDLKVSDTLTWTYTSLDTATTTQTNTNALSVKDPSGCTPSYSGPGQFIVLQDNDYGTFMFYPEI